MGETAFQVHYQYLLSEIWKISTMVSYLIENKKSVGHFARMNLHLDEQRRQLESLYPDFYKNFKDTLDYRESLKKKHYVV